MSNAFKLLGIDDEVTTCDLCGKADLKCTMVLAELDADGSEVGVVRYGRDCGARALGWRVSADRAEKLVRGTATVRYADLSDAVRGLPADYSAPVRVQLDGVLLEVWRPFYLGSLPSGWTPVNKAADLGWRVAPHTPDVIPSDDEVAAAVVAYASKTGMARDGGGWCGDSVVPGLHGLLEALRARWPSLPSGRSGRAIQQLLKAGRLSVTTPNGHPLERGVYRLRAA